MKESLEFLAQLAQNNEKEWMDANRTWYLKCREDFKEFIAELIAYMEQIDPEMTGLRPQDCLFRINRDIRFSKNKAPYKVNFSASLSSGGRHSPNADYYVHIQPGNESFIGGGLYTPPSELLQKIRQEVDYNAEELKDIVNEKKFQPYFGAIQGEKLVRAPKGYSPDHPNIEFLKLKSFVVLHSFSDEEVSLNDFVEQVKEGFKLMKPFNDYLNVAIS